MKKIMLLFLTVFVFTTNFAFASDNYIKIYYHPGYDISERTIDVILSDVLGGDDNVIAGVYKKLKEIKVLGSLDYVVPDAPSISIEVKYKNEVIKSTNSLKVSKPEKFQQYQKVWEEAYFLVWGAVKERLEIRGRSSR
jgi:hypothetical protein